MVHEQVFLAIFYWAFSVEIWEARKDTLTYLTTR